jgi:hypothetical protein
MLSVIKFGLQAIISKMILGGIILSNKYRRIFRKTPRSFWDI